MGNLRSEINRFLKETNKMKEFKGEKYSPKRAQDHLKTLKNKLTDKKLADIHADKKVKIAERELRRVQRDLRAARRAAAAAEQEVQAAKEQQNKTHTDAKEAKGDVLYFSTAIELTAFTENEKKLTQMQKELGAVFEKSTQLGAQGGPGWVHPAPSKILSLVHPAPSYFLGDFEH